MQRLDWDWQQSLFPNEVPETRADEERLGNLDAARLIEANVLHFAHQIGKGRRQPPVRPAPVRPWRPRLPF